MGKLVEANPTQRSLELSFQALITGSFSQVPGHIMYWILWFYFVVKVKGKELH